MDRHNYDPYGHVSSFGVKCEMQKVQLHIPDKTRSIVEGIISEMDSINETPWSGIPRIRALGDDDEESDDE